MNKWSFDAKIRLWVKQYIVQESRFLEMPSRKRLGLII
ncbi:hypothetical protein SD78_2995 [Bacillus badius]|nr:hypothetical protein SD78_2995 [Bacillus badius]